MGLGASKPQKGASALTADVAWATKSWIQVAPKPTVKDESAEAQAAEAQAAEAKAAKKARLAARVAELKSKAVRRRWTATRLAIEARPSLSKDDE